MKVIHIITGLATGGAEKALYNLLHGGLIDSFDNYVISLSDIGTIGPQIRGLGVPVIVLGMRGGRPSLSGFIRLLRVIKEIHPEVIQGWMYHGNLAATLARRIASGRISLVWNIRQSLYDLRHEKPLTQSVIRLNSVFSKSPDVLLYNSRLSRKQHETFGFASCKGQVIPNGIDIRSFRFSGEARSCVRSELDIPEAARVVGHVARLHPMKDHVTFLRAAAAIALRRPEVHFLLSGRDVSLDTKALQQLIPWQLRKRFHLVGEHHNIPELLSAMDIFCLSSAWGEGFPNVIGEAMATGLPCVATDVGDSAMVVGDTGVIVPPQDEVALVTGIEKLLAMSQEERRTLGTSARSRIESNYTLGEIVKQYTAMYKKLAQKPVAD